MRLYLVRHGESMGNATGDYSTKVHDSLSEKGWLQAHALADRLGRTRFDAVYCSPLLRALQTVYPYAKARRRTVEIWPELAESCWHEDRTVRPETPETGLRLVPHVWDNDLNRKFFAWRDARALQPAGDEDYSQGLYRVGRAAGLLAERHAGRDHRVLVVSHGYTLSRLIEFLLGEAPEGRYDHRNTGLTCLEELDGRRCLRFQDSLDGPLD